MKPAINLSAIQIIGIVMLLSMDAYLAEAREDARQETEARIAALEQLRHAGRL